MLDRDKQTNVSDRLLSLGLYFSISSITNLFTSSWDTQIAN